MGESYVTYRGNCVNLFGGEFDRKRLLGSTWCRWDDNIKIHLKK